MFVESATSKSFAAIKADALTLKPPAFLSDDAQKQSAKVSKSEKLKIS